MLAKVLKRSSKMKKSYTNSKYKNIGNCLQISKNKNLPSKMFRQELITWEYTNTGIKKTTTVRTFNEDNYIDSFVSEPIVFKKFH